ncbi:hypothetical protein [uncultured Dokdonia sp.]|uniref:hypothetical protein n=1 Tax=uncultured Dokdonia sp. TaxID=575653 RepID=UPI00260F2B69|nr:hypothetical protein [uncultured Dokdonia sp.]
MDQIITNAEVSTASIIGFFVIVIVGGFFLHLVLSKTGIYKKRVKAKGFLAKFLYFGIFLILLYIVLLVIFGIIKLIGI